MQWVGWLCIHLGLRSQFHEGDVGPTHFLKALQQLFLEMIGPEVQSPFLKLAIKLWKFIFYEMYITRDKKKFLCPNQIISILFVRMDTRQTHIFGYDYQIYPAVYFDCEHNIMNKIPVSVHNWVHIHE